MISNMSMRQRLISLVIYVIILLCISGVVTGAWIPTEGGKSIWFYSALGFFFFTYLTSPYFVTPRDSLANSVASALLLATLNLRGISEFRDQLDVFRWLSFWIAVVVAVSAVAAIVLFGMNLSASPGLRAVSQVTYGLSDRIGRGEIMFSPAVLISIVGFYQSAASQQLWLLFLWAILLFTRPVDLVLHVINSVKALISPKAKAKRIGVIDRIDEPGIVRVKLDRSESWKQETIHIADLPDARQVEVLPLFVQLLDTELIGTGYCHRESSQKVEEAISGEVYLPSAPRSSFDVIKELCGAGPSAKLIGFVVENSDISRICFEIASSEELAEGWLVYVCLGKAIVYYQILNAQTKEESFSKNYRGTQVVFAGQLGVLSQEKGFVRYAWLPPMNAPVFLPDASTQVQLEGSAGLGDIQLGVIPHSGISVCAKFDDMLEHHTAILGSTGTGKTELAFDIIRHAITKDVKVICVDFTGEYMPRLKDLCPQALGLDDKSARELQERLFDVETGEFSAGKEKRALHEFVEGIRPEIQKQAHKFLGEKDPKLGVFSIEEIANTRATLRATELYLSTVFDWARKHRRARRILLVLEEAHTIVPEANLFGFDRVETGAVIGRMAQIALQGRKYGIGILLISQRTALVSKTLLSQCNTVLSFALHDETGLNYLATVFSSEHVKAIPNLHFLEGVAFGKALRSDRPVIFSVLPDESKRKASEALNVPEVEKSVAVSHPGEPA
jgi:hypothetical protein